MNRPNILLIMTDQQSADAMSCAGNDFIETPAMDGLAEKGIRFERAYCSYPHCVPSRSAMFYGRVPHEALYPGTSVNLSGHSDGPIGVRDEYREQEIAKMLTGQGYDCVYAGKWHVGAWGPTESLREDDDTAFRSLCDIHDPNLPEACAGYFRDRPDDRPFFMVASLDNPHNICEWGFGTPLPWGNLPEPPVRGALPPLPPNFPPSYDEPGHIRTIRHTQKIEHEWTHDDWRRFRWAYNRLVEKSDREIARLLKELDRAGVADETVIIFTSDHGDQQGAHELKHKNVFYDESSRVPFVMSDPWGCENGKVDRQTLVSNALDLYATILDYAGAALPDDMHGVSLRPLARGEALENEHDFVASEHDDCHGPRRRMIRTRRFKYCVYEKGARTEQLFDMEKDPGEMVNLVTCAAFSEVLGEHRRLCADWMETTGDQWHAGHYTHPEVQRVRPGEDFPNASGSRQADD